MWIVSKEQGWKNEEFWGIAPGINPTTIYDILSMDFIMDLYNAKHKYVIMVVVDHFSNMLTFVPHCTHLYHP